MRNQTDTEIGAAMRRVNTLLHQAGVRSQSTFRNGRAVHRFLVPMGDGRMMSIEAESPPMDVEIGAGRIAKKIKKGLKKVAKSKAFGKLLKAGAMISSVVPGGQALGAGLAVAAKVQKGASKVKKAVKVAKKGVKLVAKPKAKAKAKPKPTPKPKAAKKKAPPPPPPPPPAQEEAAELEQPEEAPPEDAIELPADELEQAAEESEAAAAEPEEAGDADAEIGALVGRANALYKAAGVRSERRWRGGVAYHRFTIPLADGRRVAFSSAVMPTFEIGAKPKSPKQAKKIKKGAGKVAKTSAAGKLQKHAPKVVNKAAKPKQLKAALATSAKVKAVAKKKGAAKPAKLIKAARATSAAPRAAASSAPKSLAQSAAQGARTARAKLPTAPQTRPLSATAGQLVTLPSGRRALVTFLAS